VPGDGHFKDLFRLWFGSGVSEVFSRVEHPRWEHERSRRPGATDGVPDNVQNIAVGPLMAEGTSWNGVSMLRRPDGPATNAEPVEGSPVPVLGIDMMNRPSFKFQFQVAFASVAD
jgi:hypothetical protein